MSKGRNDVVYIVRHLCASYKVYCYTYADIYFKQSHLESYQEGSNTLHTLSLSWVGCAPVHSLLSNTTLLTFFPSIAVAELSALYTDNRLGRTSLFCSSSPKKNTIKSLAQVLAALGHAPQFKNSNKKTSIEKEMHQPRYSPAPPPQQLGMRPPTQLPPPRPQTFLNVSTPIYIFPL
ncbi:unnamed protein product [Ceratitis capitata]|uniref:(Mediterranean fruit fly) hypothetical protein n=1 Tax=Ceratitis capitata TaxID=7213 RepID=A0A811UV23_CERCA|nr:unnamed protein product [Ceratitis capitata]